MTRVLVTGASGFIGRQAVPALRAAGFEVHAISRGEGPEESGARWHRADLLDAHALEAVVAAVRPTHLLHLAWYATPGRFWMAPENLDWAAASLKLLAAFARHGGQRLVGAGTCAEYDWTAGVCRESGTPLRPATLYGVCKHAVREVAESFATQAGLGFAWGRIFFVYGPGEHPERLVASVTRSLLEGRPAPCSQGDQVRDFLHVGDVGAAFAALVASDVQGAVNVASGRGVAVRDVVLAIAERLGRPDLLRLGAVPTSASDPAVLVGDASRLANEVGWRPRYGLEAGLAQTIDWWRAEGVGAAAQRSHDA